MMIEYNALNRITTYPMYVAPGSNFEDPIRAHELFTVVLEQRCMWMLQSLVRDIQVRERAELNTIRMGGREVSSPLTRCIGPKK
jgi:hypothetical protein